MDGVDGIYLYFNPPDWPWWAWVILITSHLMGACLFVWLTIERAARKARAFVREKRRAGNE